MNAILEQVNSAGLWFVEFALPMLVQSSLLILILLLADFALRKKVRAVFRYWIWLLVLFKLVLPTSLSSPLSLGYFFGDQLAYVDRTETTTEAETMEPTQAIVSPIIYPPRIEAGNDISAIAPTTPTIEPVVTGPLSLPIVPVAPLSWQGVVFLAWLTVVVAMGLLLLQRAFFVRGLVAQAKEANGFMTDTLESCRRSMGVKRKLGLKVSANATSPAVCGLFRPVILVPQNLTSTLSANQLQAVLLHELAHIRRSDLWVNLAQTVLQIIYFYNPLLWLANCIIRRVREQAVDEMVLVAMGEKARQYPQTLVNVAKMAFKRPALSLRLIGVVESKSALAGRIKHILNRPMPKRAKLGILGLAVVIITAAILLPMATCTPGPPSLVIKGVVKDAQTGKPIAGARVFDDGYGSKPNWEQIKANERSKWGAITNSAGEYSFLTWPEHHSIKVEAPGYKAERRSLYDGHFVFNKKDEEIFDFALEPEKVLKSSGSKKILSNGVTVELIGICEHPSEGKQWWRPDGQTITKPYERLNYTERSEDSNLYEVVYRLLGSDDVISSIYSNSEVSGHIFYELRQKTENLNIHNADNAYGAILLVKPEAKSIQLEIGAGRDSDWKTLCTQDRPVDSTGTTGPGVVFQPAIEKEGKTYITIAHRIKDSQIRIVAVDNSDRLHKAEGFVNISGQELGSCQARFNLPPDQIREIQFQTQKLRRAIFKNVSLKPNFKTDVQVEAEGAKGKAVTTYDDWVSVVGSENGPSVTVRKVLNPEGTQYFKKFDLQYLLEIVSKSFGQDIAEAVGRKSSGLSTGPSYIQKHIGFGIPFSAKGVDGFRKMRQFQKELRETIKEDIKKTLGGIAGGGGSGDLLRIRYRAESTIGTINIFFSEKDEDITQIMFVIQEVVTAKDKTDVQVEAGQAAIEVPTEMVGTWFFDNPAGDDEQMSVFPDGRVVVLYSNGHKDQTKYVNGFIELAEYDGAKYKMDVEEKGTLVQYFDSGGSLLIGRRWRRIDPQPRTNLLRPLTGPDSSKADVQGEDTKIAPGSSGEAVDSSELAGRVVDENGNTVADAQVAISTEKIGVLVSNGKLQPIRSGVENRIVQTDSQGMFVFGQMPVDNFDLIVAHEKGFAMVESEEFVASGEIHLQPWGHIDGQLAEGRKAAGNKIWMSSLPNPTWFRHKREYRDETKCDESGHFVFDKVPSGWFEVGYLTRSGKNTWSHTSRTPVVVKPGQTTKMRLGGEGRPVTGRFVPPEGYDKSIYFGEGSRSLLTVRPKEPRPDNYDRMTKQQQRQWREQWHKTDEYKKYRDDYWHHPDWRQYTFFIEKDGSFRIDDVIAGKYQLTVWIEERHTGQGRPEEIAGYYGTIEVPEIPGGRSDEPLDLGELELTMHNPLRVGDIAPLFEAKTLDGKNMKLIDYRGKFVLLSFWHPVFHPEKQQLQELYDTYGGNRQLEIIGLGGNDTLEEVKNYVRENAIPWPQIYTGEEFKSGIAKDYGGFGIFLIDPDGRIIAKDLRGEKLKSVVSEAIEVANVNKPDVQVEGEKAQSLIFHGLDLTAVPHTTNSSKLPDLFEARPLGSKSYHIQKDVTAIYSGLDGTVYFIPRRNIFYVQHDKLGSSTLTYYGPFEGNPVQILNLQPNVQVKGEEVEKKGNLVWGEEVNGLRAALEFVPEKGSYSMGERVEVRYYIQNVSDDDIQIVSTDWRQDRAFVKDDRGNDIAVYSTWFSGWPRLVRFILKHGETFVLESSGLGFGDADDPALVRDLGKETQIGNVIRCEPSRYSIQYKLPLPDVERQSHIDDKDNVPQPGDWKGILETGTRKLIITPKEVTDLKRFQLVLSQESMQSAVFKFAYKYRARICFEGINYEAIPELRADQYLLTGTFSAPTIPEMLDSLTQMGPFTWEKFNHTYVVYPRKESLLRFRIKIDACHPPLESVVRKILDQSPDGREFDIKMAPDGPTPDAYPNRPLQHLWITESSAMYALSRALEQTGQGIIWALTEHQGGHRLSLHHLPQAQGSNVRVDVEER